MKTLVLVFHPHLSDQSHANAALAQAARELPAGTVTVRDMYALYPDGAIDVAAEQRLVEGHDRIVFQFPLWWYSAPSLLKDWEDQVLAFGWAYGPDGEALKGRRITVAATMGGEQSEYQPAEGGASIDEVLAPYRMMARYTGAVWEAPFTVFGAMELSAEALADAACRYQEFLAK